MTGNLTESAPNIYLTHYLSKELVAVGSGKSEPHEKLQTADELMLNWGHPVKPAPCKAFAVT